MSDNAIELKERIGTILSDEFPNCEVITHYDESLPEGDEEALLAVELAGCVREPHNPVQLTARINLWIFTSEVERETAEEKVVDLTREVENILISSASKDPKLVKSILTPPGLYTHYGRNAPLLEDLRPHRHCALIEAEFSLPLDV